MQKTKDDFLINKLSKELIKYEDEPMPIILCEKHGRSGFLQSCKHVKEKLIGGEKYLVRDIWNILLGKMPVCEDCIKKYSLSKYLIGEENNDTNASDSDPFAEGADQKGSYWHEWICWYEREGTNVKGWCSRCYNELLENSV